MKPIGGFFELEIPQHNKEFHKNSLCLSTGRACLNFIIQNLKPLIVHIPFYSCNSILEPIETNKIKYRFYKINNKLEIDEDIKLGPKDYLIYINYFGLKKEYVKQVYRKFGKNIIVDNTQAFFEKPMLSSISFNSARKFFGVPDGAYLWGISKTTKHLQKNTDINCNHLVSRLIGETGKGYKEFLDYEQTLSSAIKKVSVLSEKILGYINYENVKKIRIDNFRIYERAFKKFNLLKLNPITPFVPFAYPLLLEESVNKKKLFSVNIFIPSLWEDVFLRKSTGFKLEKEISRKLLPLPLDHRYNKADIDYVIEAVKSLI